MVLATTDRIESNETWPVEPCLNGYNYDTSEVTSSIVIDVSTQVSKHMIINYIVRKSMVTYKIIHVSTVYRD